MKSLITEIPETKEELIQWLEPILVSGELRQLVSELAVLSTHGKPSDLNSLLGGKLDLALEHGLGQVAEADLRRLLRHPFSLVELQQAILEKGDQHWLQLVEMTNAAGNESELRARLAQQIALEKPESKSESENLASLASAAANGQSWRSKVRDRNKPETRLAAGSNNRLWLMTMAAGLLLALTVGFFVIVNSNTASNAPVAWGWSADEDLDHLTPTEYLNKLARGADAWFNKRPTRNSELRQRLIEFRTGCQKLIDSEHAVLDQASKDRLLNRLMACLRDVDLQLARLDGADPTFTQILADVDQIIRDVKEDLQDYAASLKSQA
ncbi:MAG TPA: hypothetical protein PKD64_04285 [Pirellulaceae bacterium]|nr:hypothetical protein [Pirellulaceae bacterium]HMO91391.1 hypothetical protein [Pirellulaceae bacterium]HMP69616.1 hypothetical protein [Pirellulaceae bacterium]